MSADSGRPESNGNDVVFRDDGGRPIVVAAGQAPQFRPHDEVYLQPGRRGPYKIRTPMTPERTYTLVDAGGNLVDGGAAVSEHDLQLADPFA